MTPCVVFQVSQPYSSTDLTVELKSLIFVEIEILDAFHTLLRLAKAVLAFPILVLTSASVPPFPSIMLPRQVCVQPMKFLTNYGILEKKFLKIYGKKQWNLMFPPLP